MNKSKNFYNPGCSKRTKQRQKRRQKIKEIAQKIDLDAISTEVAQMRQRSNALLIANNNIVSSQINQDSFGAFQPSQDCIDRFSPVLDEDFNSPDQTSCSLENLNQSDSSILIIEQNLKEENITLPNDDLLCTSLLTLFFSANLTQEALKLVIEHTQLLTNIKIPKTFNQLMSRILDEKPDYTKTWYCKTCNSYVELSDCKQRICSTCNSK